MTQSQDEQAKRNSLQEPLKRLFDVAFRRLHSASATVSFTQYLKDFSSRTQVSAHSIDFWRRGNCPEKENLKRLLHEVASRSDVNDAFWPIWAHELLLTCGVNLMDPIVADLLNNFLYIGDITYPPLLPLTKPFASYLHIVFRYDVDLDWLIARHLHRLLEQRHIVTISSLRPKPTAFTTSALREEAQTLRHTDAVVLLVSSTTAWSEEVTKVLTLIHSTELNRRTPVRLLPVRIAHRRPFVPPLDAHLHGQRWTLWSGHADTLPVANAIIEAINGGDLPLTDHDLEMQPVPLTKMPGALPQAEIGRDERYVLRSSDVMLMELLRKRNPSTLIIQGPGQSGKTRMLTQVLRSYQQKLGPVAIIHPDKTFEHSDYDNPPHFFQRFCLDITYQLGLENNLPEHWGRFRSNIQECLVYLEEYLLPQLQRVTLVVEKVERYFERPIQDDFFSMLRDCHNYRAHQLHPRGREVLYSRLNLVLVTSTGPEKFVKNTQRSPFNVGTVIRVDDFDIGEVRELNRLYGSPLRTQDEQQLMELLSGHPYLTNRAISLIAQGDYSAASLFTPGVESDRGVFGDHLRGLFAIFLEPQRGPALVESVQQIMRTHWHPDDVLCDRLIGLGLVKRTENGVELRCQLYRRYFEQFIQR